MQPGAATKGVILPLTAVSFLNSPASPMRLGIELGKPFCLFVCVH